MNLYPPTYQKIIRRTELGTILFINVVMKHCFIVNIISLLNILVLQQQHPFSSVSQFSHIMPKSFDSNKTNLDKHCCELCLEVSLLLQRVQRIDGID